jgi:L-fuconolactonase
MREPAFRAAVAVLAKHRLTLDVWLYHPQMIELVELAHACPGTTFVLDHVGGALGAGPFAGARDEVFTEWKRGIAAVAACANVMCKVGGLGMPIFGFGFDRQPRKPTSETLVRAWRPYIETAIEAFGVERCMFESNFPPDKQSCSYIALWNAFKRVTAGCSPGEKASLFSDTATRVYRLEETLSAFAQMQAADRR